MVSLKFAPDRSLLPWLQHFGYLNNKLAITAMKKQNRPVAAKALHTAEWLPQTGHWN